MMPGPAELLFLSLVTMELITFDRMEEPLGLWADLIGALGSCLTRAVRTNPASSVQINAALLSRALTLHLFGTAAPAAPSAHLLAQNVMDFLKEMSLPFCLLPACLSDAELKAEFRDSLRYARSENERRAVEMTRVHLVGPRWVLLHKRSLVDRLSRRAPAVVVVVGFCCSLTGGLNILSQHIESIWGITILRTHCVVTLSTYVCTTPLTNILELA